MNFKLIQYFQLGIVIRRIRKHNKIVLVTGVFDLLHQSHILFLQHARERGNILLVGLESDERVRELKGEGRPIEPIGIRLAKVSNLKQVDFAFALPRNFGSIEGEHLIAILKPDILAVSSHTLHLEQKRKIVEKYGGRLEMVMNQDLHYSTTKIILEKQSKLRSAN